jgi:hypothetical protein
MLRRHLSYANVTATLALVFAMSGGALAATQYVIKSTKQIKPSVLKSLKGNAGPAGPAGPAGAKGASGEGKEGAAGKEGASGKEGAAGKEGAPGANGSSVLASEFEGKEGPCEMGGSEFTVGSAAPTYACDGETGFTEELPLGKTETGAWSVGDFKQAAGKAQLVAISFAIPLSEEVEATVMAEGASPTEECPGSASEPKAKAGILCVYVAKTEGSASPVQVRKAAGGGAGFASTTGGVLFVGGEEGSAYGTWAVGAP